MATLHLPLYCSGHIYFNAYIHKIMPYIFPYSCHPFTGECECEPGWDLPHCDIPCPAPFYGEKCEETCDCDWDTGAQCNPVDGTCICPRGYLGDRYVCVCIMYAGSRW